MIGVQLSCQQYYYQYVLLCADENDDLLDVYREVKNLTANWRGLGLSLGIQNTDLATVQATNPINPVNCLRDMLAQWLKQNFKVCNILLPWLPCLVIDTI